MATVLGVEDKIATSMLGAVQRAQTIRSMASIHKVSVGVGVKGEGYNAMRNGFVMKSLVAQQERTAVNLQLQGVPAMHVSGKYQLSPQRMDISNTDAFIAQYTDTVKQLVEKR